MNIIICGGGKIGTAITANLCKEGHDIVVVDINPKVVDYLVNEYDVMGLCGNGANYEVLEEAGVAKTHIFIATSSSDELNILSCMVAKKFGARHCIARVRNPDYAKQQVFMREEFGLSMMVNPEYDAANEISRMLRFPAALKIDSFAKGRVELAEIKLLDHTPLCGHPINTLYKEYGVKILICAVQREDQVLIPTGDFVLQAGDKIHITGSHSNLNAFLKKLGIYKQPVHSVIIVGGGKIAYYLARQLCETGIRVKIIEQNKARCVFLSEALPKATICCGDGTDQALLLEEGIENTDACVTLTDIDEENIIVSTYAAVKGVYKNITKVNRTSLGDILDSIGLDSVITPKSITADLIVQYVRAKQNSKGSNVLTLYKLINGQLEALEFTVRENNKFLGKPLKTLPLKKDLLIASIIRGNKQIIPQGDDTIELHDSVVVVTSNPHLGDLNEILA